MKWPDTILFTKKPIADRNGSLNTTYAKTIIKSVDVKLDAYLEEAFPSNIKGKMKKLK